MSVAAEDARHGEDLFQIGVQRWVSLDGPMFLPAARVSILWEVCKSRAFEISRLRERRLDRRERRLG